MRVVISNPRSGFSLYLTEAVMEKLRKISNGGRLRFEKIAKNEQGDETLLAKACNEVDSIKPLEYPGSMPYRIQFRAIRNFPLFGPMETNASLDAEGNLRIVIPKNKRPAFARTKYRSDKKKAAVTIHKAEEPVREEAAPTVSAPPPVPTPSTISAAPNTVVLLDLLGETFEFELPAGDALRTVLEWSEKGFRKPRA